MKIYKTLPDGMTIVEYDETLAQAVADMWNKSGDGWGGNNDLRTAAQIIADYSGGSYFNIYLAVKNGEVLGFCSYNRYYKDEDSAYVQTLNVRPDHHGKKIGKELVLMCVEETIARGMPRLDIHTWPGNTKAVPLYKKCGFLWENRPDSTHLCNYIPSVIKDELFADFFEYADWYADSTRAIEIKPDGVKQNKFEFAYYEWEHNGEYLKVGYEKTGRGIRYAETDDYKIEMTADTHEPAFGFTYGAAFNITNKSGKKLDVEINGVADGVIDFNCSFNKTVEDETVFDAPFFVNKIDEPQDTWRKHPRVLADVTINGKKTQFGLGIEPKFPLTLSLTEKRKYAAPGLTYDCFINIQNALPRDAKVTVTLPENGLTAFEDAQINADLKKDTHISVPARATVKQTGYAAVPAKYKITLDNGEEYAYTRPLRLVNQGVDGAFRYETDDEYGAVNGVWRLAMKKNGNDAAFRKTGRDGLHFNMTRLGKPYDDEFNIMKPADTRFYTDGAYAVFEADFKSGRFAGALLTEIYAFNASGVFKKLHKLTNLGMANQQLHIMADMWTDLARRPVFHYKNRFHAITDDVNSGFSSIEQEYLDENWIFNDDPENYAGMYWPAAYKPYTKWGDGLQFEFDAGELPPGGTFETEDIVYISGVFDNYSDFRDYALGVNNEVNQNAHNHIEFGVNGGNPVVPGGAFTVQLINNRLTAYNGDVEVSSPDGAFKSLAQPYLQTDGPVKNTFSLNAPGANGICETKISLRFANFEKDCGRLVLTPDNGVNVETVTENVGDTFTVVNGKMRFSVSPRYSCAVHSLIFNGVEWLFAMYPEHKPYSWWNPFIGGLQTYVGRLGARTMLDETVGAEFVNINDNFGNNWRGIRADMTVLNFDEYRGLRIGQYYLTLPGAPVLAHFTEIRNDTGRYMDLKLSSEAFFSGKDGLTDIYAAFTTYDGQAYKTRYGEDCGWGRIDGSFAVTRAGGNPAAENLYIYKDARYENGQMGVSGDINHAMCDIDARVSVKNGGRYITKPLFVLLSDKRILTESFTDFANIYFGGNR